MILEGEEAMLGERVNVPGSAELLEADYHRYERVYQRYFPEKQPVRVSTVVKQNIHHALIDFKVMAVKAYG
jgi:hypothetical protein